MELPDLLNSLISVVHDFPQSGIVFRDIFPIFANPKAVELVVDHFVRRLQLHDPPVNCIAGLDARGFLFGPMIALRLGIPFVPVRKAGKIPGETISVPYGKEYGKDAFEMHKTSLIKDKRVVLVDDLLATGGSLAAACTLIERLGGIVAECLVIIELDDLEGIKKIVAPVYSIVHY